MVWRKKPVLLVSLCAFASISLLLVYMFVCHPVVQETFVLAYSEEAKSVLNLTQGEHVSIWLSTLPPGMSGRSAQQYVIEFYVTDPTAQTVLNATGTVETGLLSPLSFATKQSGAYTIHIKNTLGGSFIKTVSLSYRATYSIYSIPVEFVLLLALAATAVPILMFGVEMLRKRETRKSAHQAKGGLFRNGPSQVCRASKAFFAVRPQFPVCQGAVLACRF